MQEISNRIFKHSLLSKMLVALPAKHHYVVPFDPLAIGRVRLLHFEGIHLFSLSHTWLPNYWINQLVAISAMIVIATVAVVAVRLVPEILKLPHLSRLKEINEALQLQVSELRQNEANLRELIEAVPDALIVANNEGKIVLSNVQAEELFGYCKEEFLGMAVEMLIPARFREGHQDHQKRFFTNPRSRPMGTGFQLFGRRKNGEVFPADISLSPLKRGNDMLVSGTVRDVTEHKRIQDEIRNLNDALVMRNAELISANKELESFSYSVAHDLRSPLRAIDGFSLAILEDHADSLDEDSASHLKRIRDAAMQMDRLIDDLLSLAKTSRTELIREQVDLSLLAGEILLQLQNAEPQRKVTYTVAPNLIASGDRGLLRSAMENLLGNAWKFSAKRSDAHIEVGSIHVGGEELYFVRDNGVGFDMQYADRIFGTFQRLHNQSEFPGTGIGLAIVQRVVQRHNGRIWAEASVNHGATFYFSLQEKSSRTRAVGDAAKESQEVTQIKNRYSQIEEITSLPDIERKSSSSSSSC